MGQYDFVPTLVSRYASTALYFYDILLTLDDEVAYVWKAKWTFPKVLYLWVRYPGFFAQLFTCLSMFATLAAMGSSDRGQRLYSYAPASCQPRFTRVNSVACLMLCTSCIGYNLFYSTWLWVSSGSTDALLLMRVLALAKGNRALRITIRGIYVGVYVLLLGLLGYNYYGWFHRVASFPENLGCIQTMYVGDYPTLRVDAALIPIATAPLVVLNTTLLVVVLYVLLPLARREASLTPLLGALIQDGVAYFVIVAGTTLMTTITALIYFDVPRATTLGEPWFLAIGPMAASRLFLHLRATMAHPERSILTRKAPVSGETDAAYTFTTPSTLESAVQRTTKETGREEAPL